MSECTETIAIEPMRHLHALRLLDSESVVRFRLKEVGSCRRKGAEEEDRRHRNENESIVCQDRDMMSASHVSLVRHADDTRQILVTGSRLREVRLAIILSDLDHQSAEARGPMDIEDRARPLCRVIRRTTTCPQRATAAVIRYPPHAVPRPLSTPAGYNRWTTD